MAEHTPGPWRIKYGPGHAPDECHIEICGDIFILATIDGPHYAHCEANARLIAKAWAIPALVEALEFYLDAWDGHPGDSGPGGNWPADPEWNPDEALLEDGGQRARAALALIKKNSKC